MEHTGVWIAYALAAAVMLLLKLCIYLRDSEKYGKTQAQSLREWFFEASLNNAISWLTTALIVWVLGYLYIEEVINYAGITGTLLNRIPVSVPVAALFGAIAEMAAPAVTKWIAGRISTELQVPGGTM